MFPSHVDRPTISGGGAGESLQVDHPLSPISPALTVLQVAGAVHAML